jgi:23S rRNA (adenine-N6)-dimethyltransferase
LARELARDAGIGRDDLVLEIGAGAGILTAALSERARRVIAVEADPALASKLRRRFEGWDTVHVVQADALTFALPAEPFKVVSNPPFHIASPLLRHLLDDPTKPLMRADLILSWGQAIGLTQVHPPSPVALRWLPWFELLLLRRLAASSFRPPPTVDAAVVSFRRRHEPLLDMRAARDFRRYLRIRADSLPRRGSATRSLPDIWKCVSDYSARG